MIFFSLFHRGTTLRMDFKGQVLCLMTQKEIKIITDTEPEEKTLLGAGHITGKTHIYLDKMCQQSD